MNKELYDFAREITPRRVRDIHELVLQNVPDAVRLLREVQAFHPERKHRHRNDRAWTGVQP